MKFIPKFTPKFAPKFTPNQKEQLHRSRPLLFLVVLGLLALPWIFLYFLGAQVRRQKPIVDQQADTYFTQLPLHEQNASAEILERLASHLGLPFNIKLYPPIAVDPQAREVFRAIRPSLNHFLQTQTTKTNGSLDPVPPELQAYLKRNEPVLTAVQSHILTQPSPQWALDISRLNDVNYTLPGFVNILELQKLLLLSAIHYQQQNQPTQAILSLEVSWQLNQAIKQRPDLTSQTLASVVLAQQTGLIRHIEAIPKSAASDWQEKWQQRMNGHTQQHTIVQGVTFETWLRYQVAQTGFLETASPTVSANSLQSALTHLSNRFSPRAYFQLTFIANTRSANQALIKLAQMNVCDTPPVIAERMLKDDLASRWRDSTTLSPFLTTKRWKKDNLRSLARELSQQVLWAKQHLNESGEWPTALHTPASETCLGERWIYTVTDDNTMTITFSKRLVVLPTIPLHYRDTSQQK